jgi:RimJ/RimL family protein N-acetyltransferase
VIIPAQTQEQLEQLSDWSLSRTGISAVFEMALAVLRDGELIAVAGYHGRALGSIHITVAADSPRWCLPGHVTSILGLPFSMYPIHRITAMAQVDNRASRKLIRGVGFLEEANLRAFGENGEDYMIHGMTRRWWERSRWGERWRRAAALVSERAA